MFDSPPVAPVLGIDPGLSRCGYGAVVREGAQVRAIAAGVIRTDVHAPLPERLARLADELVGLFDELRPGAVAVERVLFQVNARTAISVGQASGLALAEAARRGLPVVQYSPNEVKLAITGDGAADKAAVGSMVARLLGLREIPGPPDAADALALALCHVWRARVASAAAASRSEGRSSPSVAASNGERLQRAIDRALAKTEVRR